MKTDPDFKYNYQAPTAEERREIESIRNSYLPQNKQADKLLTLRRLDSKVRNIPKTIALSIGIVGILIFGLGLAMILEWQIMFWGIMISVIGLIIMLINYPLFVKITKGIKGKYSDQILNLSEELLQNGKN